MTTVVFWIYDVRSISHHIVLKKHFRHHCRTMMGKHEFTVRISISFKSVGVWMKCMYFEFSVETFVLTQTIWTCFENTSTTMTSRWNCFHLTIANLFLFFELNNFEQLPEWTWYINAVWEHYKLCKQYEYLHLDDLRTIRINNALRQFIEFKIWPTYIKVGLLNQTLITSDSTEKLLCSI